MAKLTGARTYCDSEDSSQVTIGRWKPNTANKQAIFCIRYKLELESNEYARAISFDIGGDDGDVIKPEFFSAETYPENGFWPSMKAYCVIGNLENEFVYESGGFWWLNTNNLLSATTHQIELISLGSSKYKIKGTVEQHFYPDQQYYLWIYLNGGYGRLKGWKEFNSANSAQNDESVTIHPLGLAKIYLPKTTGSTEYEYKDALVYIYTNGTWQLALPYIYTGGTWKNTC